MALSRQLWLGLSSFDQEHARILRFASGKDIRSTSYDLNERVPVQVVR